MQIAIDQPFPSFSLPAIDPEGNQTTQSNESMLGKKWVLFVYPKDQTPGCTVEACSFRDLSAEFGKVGVEVYGLSRDNIRAHSNFIKKQDLSYTLIADAPPQTVTQVVQALPRSGSPGVLDRLGRGFLRLARVLNPFG